MEYETKILPRTGGYGRYNRLVVVFSWFPNFAVMLNLISDVFYTLIPDSYNCKPDPELLPSTFLLSNFTRQGYLNLTIPWVNGIGLSHCELFKYPSNSSDLSENVPRERVSCTRGWEYGNEAGLHSNFVTEVRHCLRPHVSVETVLLNWMCAIFRAEQQREQQQVISAGNLWGHMVVSSQR